MDITSPRHEHFSTWPLNFSAPQMLSARAWSLPKISPGASQWLLLQLWGGEAAL